MRHSNKFITYVLALIFCFSSLTLAFDTQETFFGTTSLISETKTSKIIKNDVKKEEVISIVEYKYPNWLPTFNKKYVNVHISIAYYDALTKEVLALASFTSSFRYNSKTQRACCLSTNSGSIADKDNVHVNTSSRKNNSDNEIGGSISHIKFKYKGITYENETYNLFCDYLGNINNKLN